jgi:hypothetical protein
VSQLVRVWNPLIDSLIRLNAKLQDLGFVYYNGNVTIIEHGKEDQNG